MPTELDGLSSILSMRAHLPKYWSSVLFASLVDPVSNVPLIPTDIVKYKDEWLANDGGVFAQHVLEHAWDKIDWWALHAFAQRCQLGGVMHYRPVDSQFVDGEAHRILSSYIDRFVSAFGWVADAFTTKTADLVELYAKADALQTEFASEADQLRSALSASVLALLKSVQVDFKAALANPAPSSTLPGGGQQLDSAAYDSLTAEIASDLKARGGRSSRVFSELAPRELEARLVSLEALLAQANVQSTSSLPAQRAPSPQPNFLPPHGIKPESCM